MTNTAADNLPSWLQVGATVHVLTQGRLLPDRVDQGVVERIGLREIVVRVGNETHRFRRPGLTRRITATAFDVREARILDERDPRLQVVRLRLAIEAARDAMTAWSETPEDEGAREAATAAIRVADEAWRVTKRNRP